MFFFEEWFLNFCFDLQITLHHEENKDVKITAIDEQEPEWFYSRIKCFPLYSILSAIYRTNIDLVSLGCQGSELKVSFFYTHKLVL